MLTLLGCSAPVSAPEPAPAPAPDLAPDLATRAAVTALDPFRQAALQPPLLAALPMAAGRSYAIMIHLPGPAPVDLSSPAAAQRGLRQFLNPVALIRSGTGLGHAIVGWRCGDDPRPVLVAKSGERSRQGLRMLMSGWGLAAMLSDYDDGYLQTPAAPGTRYGRVLAQGLARVVALEIAQADCARMRRSLSAYVTDPAQPAALFTMMPQPGRPLGEGCGGFAMWLAGQGGVFPGLERLVMRPVPLSDRFIGTGRRLPAGVTPFRAEGAAPAAPIPPLRLIFGNWEGGRDLGTTEVMDMELLLLALDRAMRLAGPDYTPAARLQPDLPLVRDVSATADAWLARYRRVTPLRFGRARAVVLHLH